MRYEGLLQYGFILAWVIAIKPMVCFDADEDDIIEQAMSEDNKLASGVLQPTEDMMDMDLIKRADTNYGMPGDGGPMQPQQPPMPPQQQQPLQPQPGGRKPPGRENIVSDMKKYGLWEYTTDTTGMGDQIKELMKNSHDTGDAGDISSETLLKHADKVNEEIDKFAENPPTVPAPTIDPYDTPLGFGGQPTPPSATKPGNQDNVISISDNALSIEDEHGNNLDNFQQQSNNNNNQDKSSDMKPTTPPPTAAPGKRVGSTIMPTTALTLKLLNALKSSKPFLMHAQKLLDSPGDSDEDQFQKQKKLLDYLKEYETEKEKGEGKLNVDMTPSHSNENSAGSGGVAGIGGSAGVSRGSEGLSSKDEKPTGGSDQQNILVRVIQYLSTRDPSTKVSDILSLLKKAVAGVGSKTNSPKPASDDVNAIKSPPGTPDKPDKPLKIASGLAPKNEDIPVKVGPGMAAKSDEATGKVHDVPIKSGNDILKYYGGEIAKAVEKPIPTKTDNSAIVNIAAPPEGTSKTVDSNHNKGDEKIDKSKDKEQDKDKEDKEKEKGKEDKEKDKGKDNKEKEKDKEDKGKDKDKEKEKENQKEKEKEKSSSTTTSTDAGNDKMNKMLENLFNLYKAKTAAASGGVQADKTKGPGEKGSDSSSPSSSTSQSDSPSNKHIEKVIEKVIAEKDKDKDETPSNKASDKSQVTPNESGTNVAQPILDSIKASKAIKDSTKDNKEKNSTLPKADTGVKPGKNESQEDIIGEKVYDYLKNTDEFKKIISQHMKMFEKANNLTHIEDVTPTENATQVSPTLNSNTNNNNQKPLPEVKVNVQNVTNINKHQQNEQQPKEPQKELKLTESQKDMKTSDPETEKEAEKEKELNKDEDKGNPDVKKKLEQIRKEKERLQREEEELTKMQQQSVTKTNDGHLQQQETQETKDKEHLQRAEEELTKMQQQSVTKTNDGHLQQQDTQETSKLLLPFPSAINNMEAAEMKEQNPASSYKPPPPALSPMLDQSSAPQSLLPINPKLSDSQTVVGALNTETGPDKFIKSFHTSATSSFNKPTPLIDFSGAQKERKVGTMIANIPSSPVNVGSKSSLLDTGGGKSADAEAEDDKTTDSSGLINALKSAKQVKPQATEAARLNAIADKIQNYKTSATTAAASPTSSSKVAKLKSIGSTIQSVSKDLHTFQKLINDSSMKPRLRNALPAYINKPYKMFGNIPSKFPCNPGEEKFRAECRLLSLTGLKAVDTTLDRKEKLPLHNPLPQERLFEVNPSPQLKDVVSMAETAKDDFFVGSESAQKSESESSSESSTQESQEAPKVKSTPADPTPLTKILTAGQPIMLRHGITENVENQVPFEVSLGSHHKYLPYRYILAFLNKKNITSKVLQQAMLKAHERKSITGTPKLLDVTASKRKLYPYESLEPFQERRRAALQHLLLTYMMRKHRVSDPSARDSLLPTLDHLSKIKHFRMGISNASSGSLFMPVNGGEWNANGKTAKRIVQGTKDSVIVPGKASASATYVVDPADVTRSKLPKIGAASTAINKNTNSNNNLTSIEDVFSTIGTGTETSKRSLPKHKGIGKITDVNLKNLIL